MQIMHDFFFLFLYLLSGIKHPIDKACTHSKLLLPLDGIKQVQKGDVYKRQLYDCGGRYAVRGV